MTSQSDQPVSAARAATEAMRTLARAPLKFEDKAGDTYDVVGDLLAITSALTNTLAHVADAHARFAERAIDDRYPIARAGPRMREVRVLPATPRLVGRRLTLQMLDAAPTYASRIVCAPSDGPSSAARPTLVSPVTPGPAAAHDGLGL